MQNCTLIPPVVKLLVSVSTTTDVPIRQHYRLLDLCCCCCRRLRNTCRALPVINSSSHWSLSARPWHEIMQQCRDIVYMPRRMHALSLERVDRLILGECTANILQSNIFFYNSVRARGTIFKRYTGSAIITVDTMSEYCQEKTQLWSDCCQLMQCNSSHYAHLWTEIYWSTTIGLIWTFELHDSCQRDIHHSLIYAFTEWCMTIKVKWGRVN